MTEVTPQMLREVAKDAGLTGAEASKLIGCNPRTWRRWVGGESEFPVAVYEWLRVVTGQHPNFHATNVAPGDYYERTGIPSEAFVRKLARSLRDAVGSEAISTIGAGFGGNPTEPFKRALSVTLEISGDVPPEKVEVARQVLEVEGKRCLVKYLAREPLPDEDDDFEASGQ